MRFGEISKLTRGGRWLYAVRGCACSVATDSVALESRSSDWVACELLMRDFIS